MIYVMSDLHGCFEEFKAMLNKIGFRLSDELYIIGDVIDRGPSPIKLLKYIMEQPNIHLILGNHESMMIHAVCNPDLDKKETEKFNQSVDTKINQELWLKNGGVITERQYMKLKKDDKIKVYNYLLSLPLLKEIRAQDKDYILIHGGIYDGFVKDLESGSVSEDILWAYFQSLSKDDEIISGKTFVFGHTPTCEYGYDNKIISLGDKYLVDCGCVFGYSLGCLCLDNDECFYVKKY